MTEQTETERNRTPVGRPDFKSGERRQTSLVGSTPTLFRQFIFRQFVACNATGCLAQR